MQPASLSRGGFFWPAASYPRLGTIAPALNGTQCQMRQNQLNAQPLAAAVFLFRAAFGPIGTSTGPKWSAENVAVVGGWSVQNVAVISGSPVQNVAVAIFGTM